MYISTFYSFKGGVGRTLALVNVALELVKRGRRVLIVDFDLEAPGISTFDQFHCADNSVGVVEFVSDYVKNGVSPDLRDYVKECEIPSLEGKLWIMPAGRQDGEYSRRLNSIDWQQLYSEMDGFLFFENMKAQWKSLFQPDYVLIDSRTGHTDVSGICTRQLPDAVVALFFPNDQNLLGLSKIVQDIRSEANVSPPNSIPILFVASNVPNLDDEDLILQNRIEKFKNSLQFRELSGTIYHYNSMSLLNQQVFTISRPRSGLAREYKCLTDRIVRLNLEDRDGALATLTELENKSRSRELFPGTEGTLSEITNLHSSDGEILARVAGIRELLGDYESVIIVLSKAIDGGYKTAASYLRRASAYRRKNMSTECLHDIFSAIDCPCSYSEMVRAVRALIDLNEELLPRVLSSHGFLDLIADEKVALCNMMNTKRQFLPEIGRVVSGIVEDANSESVARRDALVSLNLCLIGGGYFKKVISLNEEYEWLIDKELEIIFVFNSAMAAWALTNTPPKHLFQKVIELGKSRRTTGANYYQCMALANFLVGDTATAESLLEQSEKFIRANPHNEFSAWRYLTVNSQGFLADLNIMREFFRGSSVKPAFFEANPNY